jgi:nucleoside-diphosphate-sugar epimerase
MKVLVTGSAGIVGRPVVVELAEVVTRERGRIAPGSTRAS